MSRINKRWVALAVLAGGVTFAGSCSVAEAVIATIAYAFRIADVWV